MGRVLRSAKSENVPDEVRASALASRRAHALIDPGPEIEDLVVASWTSLFNEARRLQHVFQSLLFGGHLEGADVAREDQSGDEKLNTFLVEMTCRHVVEEVEDRG